MNQQLISKKMPPYHGHFNQRGFPLIEIQVIGGVASEKILAVIDTGYNGYLSIPYPIAQMTKIKRLGVQSAALANGIPTNYLEYLGIIVVGDTRIKAVIDVQLNGRVLLGNAFLKEARLCFRCDPANSLVELNYQTTNNL